MQEFAYKLKEKVIVLVRIRSLLLAVRHSEGYDSGGPQRDFRGATVKDASQWSEWAIRSGPERPPIW